MKRLLVAFLFATVSFVSSIAQPMETPVCYAFSEGSVSTLKYKFSYENEKYFIDLRLIGHGNTFKAGDQVLFVTHDGAKYTYVIPEIEEAPEYYLVEMNYSDILHYQNGLKSITLVKDGKSQPMEITRYCNQCTKKGAKDIIRLAYSWEKKRGNITCKTAIEGEKQKLEEERLKTVQAKAKVIEEEKATGAYLVNVPYYSRLYLGYAPTQDNYWHHGEGLTFGYTGGIRLGKESKGYFEFGVQFDYSRIKYLLNLSSSVSGNTIEMDHVYDKDNAFSVSIPLDFTGRFELGHTGVTLSPFIGPMVRFNLLESGSDVFQDGGQCGLKLDYRHLYVGVEYHIEFVPKNGDHTRGLAFRIGYTF